MVFDLKDLPPYSPNRNLIERLWKFFRKEALQTWHATFEDMPQAVADVLDHLDRYEAPLATLITERFRLSPRIETVVVGVDRLIKTNETAYRNLEKLNRGLMQDLLTGRVRVKL